MKLARRTISLLRIDQLVEATAGHEILNFMDAYSDYNQIKMQPPEEEKSALTISQGIHCYKIISFGLKNAGPPSNKWSIKSLKT